MDKTALTTPTYSCFYCHHYELHYPCPYYKVCKGGSAWRQLSVEEQYELEPPLWNRRNGAESGAEQDEESHSHDQA